MASRDWPAISVRVKPAKKRGGAGSYRAVSANAMTIMPCGHEIKSANLHGSPAESDRMAAEVRSEVYRAGHRHFGACRRCKS